MTFSANLARYLFRGQGQDAFGGFPVEVGRPDRGRSAYSPEVHGRATDVEVSRGFRGIVAGIFIVVCAVRPGTSRLSR